MDGWLKNNGLPLVGGLVTSAIAYGVLSSDITTLKKEYDKRGQYIPQVIMLKAKVDYLTDESIRTRVVWDKLDNTLDTLNTTLIVQQGEIKNLKEDVNDIKQAVVK